MNVLVTGAGGQLGRSMQKASAGSEHSFFFTDVCEGFDFLDITDRAAVREFVALHNIGAVVNCAAWTNVDAAETAGPIVETLNASAPENLAVAMKEAGGLLVHISTDYVFGKEPYNTPCSESQKGTPTGVYGLTKLHGEQKIIAAGCNHVILRTAWLYSEYGKNFCRTMLALTSSKPAIKVVFDQVGTPTYAADLAAAVMAVLADYAACSEPVYSKSGIYNYSNEGVCSWYDFAKAIQATASALGYYAPGAPACEIAPCHSCEFPSPVVRPAYSVLDKTKVKSVFGVRVPYWTDSLRTCMANLVSGQ